MHLWLDAVILHLDYVWFIGVLGWITLTCFWWLDHLAGRPRPIWQLIVYLSQGVGLGCAMIRHVVPPIDNMSPMIGWELVSDFSSVALIAVLVMCLPMLPRIAGVVALVASIGLQGWPVNLPGEINPISPGLWMLALGGVAALVLTFFRTGPKGSPRIDPPCGLAPWLMLAVAVFNPYGTLADLVSENRRWADLSLFLLPSALVNFGLLVALARPALTASWSDGGAWRSAGNRRVLQWLGTWLLAGLVLAWLAGGRARRTFEQGYVARAQAYTIPIDRVGLAHWLRESFDPGEEFVVGGYSRRPRTVLRAPEINLPEIIPLRNYLLRIEAMDPDVRYAHISTIHDGSLVGALLGPEGRGRQDLIVKHGPVSADDLKAWEHPAARVSSPETGPWGSLVRAWAPLLDEDGLMLGWLCLETNVSTWLAVQAQSRLQVFALVGLGIVLIVLGERHLRRANAISEANQAARAAAAADEAKSLFLAQVSHELRSPIQSVLGYAELLRCSRLDGQQRRWLEAQASHGELLLRLVNDLLDAMSLREGRFSLQPMPGDLLALVTETVESLRLRAVQKGLALELRTASSSCAPLSFDPSRLRQVVQNLVGNAIKYTVKGRILVEVRIEAAESGRQRVMLVVEDTGPGVNKEEQARLFRPFTRLQREAHIEGAGLGLAISQALCRAMGGSIAVSSDGRTGSRFEACVILREAEEVPSEPASALENGKLAGHRILIVDDNALVREFFVEALRSQGANVMEATDGQAALDILNEFRFDVVITDLSMPRMDGEELSRNLRQSGNKVRIVGASAHANLKDHARALGAGMNAFLAKPVSLRDLVDAILPDASPDALAFGSNSLSVEGLREQLRIKFLEELPANWAKLKSCYDAHLFEELAGCSHHLKGSAELFGYVALSEACGALYRAAVSEDAQSARETWRVAEDCYQRVRGE